MFKGVAAGGAGITGGRATTDPDCAGIPYMGGAMGAAGVLPAAPRGGKVTPGWADTPASGGIIGVAGGAGIPNIGDCAGSAGPIPCCGGLANRRVYSLGPSCAGAGGAAGVGAERDGPAGELNSFVYSPPPEDAAGGEGTGGTPGLAPEKAVVAPPGSTGGGGATGGIGEAFPGPDGVPNKRVNAPGSCCCAGGDTGGGLVAGGLLSSSPPGLDSGIGDWKNRVNSPPFAASAGGSALTGPAGDRNSLVNAPGSEGGASWPAIGDSVLAALVGGTA